MENEFHFSGSLCLPGGGRQQVSVRVSPPAETPDQLFECEISSGLLTHNPYRVYSPLAHDAWAEAFQLLRDALARRQGYLIDEEGRSVELPSPPRDRSWLPPTSAPDVQGIDPIFRAEGWATRSGRERERVELAIWPPIEEEPGTFCAPIRCSLLRRGEPACIYGASVKQAVYLAYRVLKAEAEYLLVRDADGQPIEIPVPTQPEPIS